jgi:4-amino-4-deoxy-L-arabinose transferase-like glycosyltransferase
VQSQDSDIRNFDRLYIQHPRQWVAVLVALYALLAGNYALNTPAWQAPDEPAHYNYIADIATQVRLPVLQAGDYDQDLLDWLRRRGFPPETPIDRVRYEGYQPPLYYLLAAPLFWLSNGNLLLLRCFGVLLGVCTILTLYRCLELVFPGKPLISVSAAAFASLLPMHIAMNAAVNNDSLAELLVAGSLLVLLRWMHGQFYSEPERPARSCTQRYLTLLGVLLGLGMLTKIYAYALAPVCLCTIAAVAWRRHPGSTLWSSIRLSLWAGLPALLMGAPWWIRNWRLYGAWDLLGTRWHDKVVAGQPTTSAWLADNGVEAFFERAFDFTFKSFWGVFGWMGVFLDERIYTAMLLFTGILFLGLLWALVRLIAGGPDMDMDDFQLWVLGLFAVLVVTVTASYVVYNLKFVQHQGRYFFWGLLPISTFVGLAWREVLRPLQGLITGILTGTLALTFFIAGSFGGGLKEWTVLTCGLFAIFLVCQPLLLIGTHELPQRLAMLSMSMKIQPGLERVLAALRTCAWMTPFLLLALLNLWIPIGVLLPQLARYAPALILWIRIVLCNQPSVFLLMRLLALGEHPLILPLS